MAARLALGRAESRCQPWRPPTNAAFPRSMSAWDAMLCTCIPSADGAAIGEASMHDYRILTEAMTGLGKGGVLMNVVQAVVLPEVILKAVTTLINLGCDMTGMLGVNLDFRVRRWVEPTSRRAGAGDRRRRDFADRSPRVDAAADHGGGYRANGTQGPLMMNLTDCRKALEQFGGKRILVVGGVMLDGVSGGRLPAQDFRQAPVMVVEVNSNPPDNRPTGARRTLPTTCARLARR